MYWHIKENIIYLKQLKIILTKKAHEHREVLERHIDELEKILVRGLSQQEIDDLIKILGKVKRNLE